MLQTCYTYVLWYSKKHFRTGLFQKKIFLSYGTRMVPNCGDRNFFRVENQSFFVDTSLNLAILKYYDILRNISSPSCSSAAPVTTSSSFFIFFHLSFFLFVSFFHFFFLFLPCTGNYLFSF